MKCFHCGNETNEYLCAHCRTEEVLDKVFDQIRFYDAAGVGVLQIGTE